MENILYDNKSIEIIRKKVKNGNLRVYPNGEIKISVPLNTSIDQIKRFISSNNLWLNKKIEQNLNQDRMRKREFVSGEDIIFNGKRYILKVIKDGNNFVKKINNKIIEMHVTNRSTYQSREKLMNSFYRKELEKKIKIYSKKWEEITNISVNEYVIRNMKTRWGSYSKEKNSIILNLKLAQKKNMEIQYVIVHELMHTKERYHNDNFKRMMSYYFPVWKKYDESLNHLL